MRKHLLSSVATALFFCGLTSTATGQTTAFVGVNVLPMTAEGRVLRNQTVLVREGRIVSITPTTAKPPAGATVIEGRGKYLMPGLSEMHAHIPGANAPAQVIDDIMFLYIANGVTTIRGMLGAPNQLVLRDRAARNEIIAPTILVGAPSLNGNTAPNPQAAADLVAKNIAAGYDLQKIHPGFTRAAYDSALAVAKRSNFKFAGHVPADVGLTHALNVRQDIDHLDGYLEAVEKSGAIDQSRIPELVKRTLDAGIYNVPTMYLWDNLFGAVDTAAIKALPEMKYVPRQWVRGWLNQRMQFETQNNASAEYRQAVIEFRHALIKALADAGALLMLGTDSPQMFNVPGYALHHEVNVLKDAGLTPWQILQSGTANVGRYTREVLGKDGAFGTVAVGQRADLVLLDANPFDDVRNLTRRAGVMVRGRWLTAADIATGLKAIAERHAVAP